MRPSHQPRRRTLPRATLLALATLAACGRFSAPSGSTGGSGGPPIGGADDARAGFGLVSLAPSTNEIAVRWRMPEGATGFGVFVGTDPGALLDGAPALVDPPGTSALLTGLIADETYFLVLGTLDGASNWVRAGTVCTARTGPVVYVDPNAAPGGNGLDSSTPLNNLFAGMLTAFALGGGNVWVAEGSLTGVSYSVPLGVDVYGGFATGFDLATRDPDAAPTVLVGPAGDDILLVEADSEAVVLDGLWFDGSAGARNALDVTSTPVELRAARISRTNRGVRFRNLLDTTVRIELTDCRMLEIGVEGFAGIGPFDLLVDGCSFDGCGQEGIDLDDLIAPAGGDVLFSARDSSFRACGEEGIDCDMSAPLTGGSGGRFEVVLKDCDFVDNVLSGVLLDIEFETFPAWSAGILVEGCIARQNLGSGIALDLDSRADVLIRRVACIGNRAHGLVVTSESFDGVAQVDSSLFQGNSGRGVRASLGNFSVLLSNCVLAGNHDGGVLADTVDASAVSCVSYLQDTPWSGVVTHACVDVQAGDLPAFEVAPQSFHTVQSANGDELTLSTPATFGSGVPAELDGDEVAREVLAAADTQVVLDSSPGYLPLPATLAVFEAGASVVEDYRPSAASPLLGAGLPHPSGAPTDAGPFGAEYGGAPGTSHVTEDVPFWLTRVQPRIGATLAPDSVLVLTFAGGEASPDSIGCTAVDALGDPVAAGFTVNILGQIVVNPPIEGWSDGTLIRVHRDLWNELLRPISAEAVFRLHVTP